MTVAPSILSVHCKLCDEEVTTQSSLPASVTAGYDLRRCPTCGFVFLVAQRRSLHGRPPSLGGDPAALPRRVLSALRFAALHRWMRRLHPRENGRLLDVGCGLGDLALFLEKRRWEVWGCDPSEDALAPCRAVLGKRFVAASFEDAALQAASFDVVLLNFSLEHMNEPRSALRKARSILRPGGVVAIRVPNIDAALAQRAGSGFQLQLPHHCSFFGPRSLRVLLQSSDLEILEMGTPLSLLEGVSVACQLWPALDPELWMHDPTSPGSLLRAGGLAVVAGLALPWAWRRCRRGQGVILHAVARRPLSGRRGACPPADIAEGR